MTHTLSMSRYPLSLICGYAFRADVAAPDRPPGKAARVGSLVHGMMEAHITQRPTPAAEPDPAELAEALAIFRGPLNGYLDSLSWSDSGVELGVRYLADTDTATEGPRRGEPGYGDHGEMDLPGTLDLMRIENGELFVADLKTGQARNAHAEQLYAQAVAVSRIYRVEVVNVGFLFAKKTKCEEPTWERLDADRLDYEAGRIVHRLRTLPQAEMKPGEHCFRCPLGQASCPAWETTAPAVPADLDAAGFFGDPEAA